VAEDLRVLGRFKEADEYLRRRVVTYELFPENVTTVRVFTALSSQWQMLVGIGAVVYQGLDYQKVKATLELMGIDRAEWADIFDGLQVMEAAALPVLNER
jgi:hypothetical protein